MSKALPLEGIRVLEIAAYISGPYCGALLASLGADVVKLEPKTGDPFRRGAGNRDAYFLQYNAGKRSIAVDLKSSRGVALVKALLPRFDVLVENSRPGKIDALGLSADDCLAINPRLVFASISGFGHGGPLRDRPAYDSIGQSISGFTSLVSDPGEIKLSGGATADLISGLVATTGVLAGLAGRATSGKGTIVRTSLYEAMSALTIDAFSNFFEQGKPPVRQSRHPQAQSFCLPTSDGHAVTVHLSVTEKFWRALAKAVEREDLIKDPRFATYADRLSNYLALEAILRAEFAKRGRDDWSERLLAADVPFAPAQSIEEVYRHPQSEWLGLMAPVRNGIALVRPPLTFEGERPPRDRDAPLIGEHTREILSEILPPSEVQELVAAGVVR